MIITRASIEMSRMPLRMMAKLAIFRNNEKDTRFRSNAVIDASSSLAVILIGLIAAVAAERNLLPNSGASNGNLQLASPNRSKIDAPARDFASPFNGDNAENDNKILVSSYESSSVRQNERLNDKLEVSEPEIETGNEKVNDNGRRVDVERSNGARRSRELKRLLVRQLSALVMNGRFAAVDLGRLEAEASSLKLDSASAADESSSAPGGAGETMSRLASNSQPDLATKADNLQAAHNFLAKERLMNPGRFWPGPAFGLNGPNDVISSPNRLASSTGRNKKKQNLMSKNGHLANDNGDVMMQKHQRQKQQHSDREDAAFAQLLEKRRYQDGAAIALLVHPEPDSLRQETPSSNSHQNQQQHNFGAMGKTTSMIGSGGAYNNASATPPTDFNGNPNEEPFEDYMYDPGVNDPPIACDNVDSNLFRRDQVIEMSDQQLANLSFKGSRRELMYCVERRFRMMNVITTIITPILFTFIILIGLVGNIAVILVIWEDRKQERELSPPNLLILDLSLADLSFIIFCIPFTGWDYAVGHWIFGDTWCRLNQYLIVVCALSSIYTLVLMSVDRFMAVVYPIQCIRIRTSRNTLYAILVKWIIILLISMPAARMHGSVGMNDNTQWQCRFLMHQYNAVHFQIIFFLASYLLPLALIFVLYMGLLNKLWFGNKPLGHRESSKMLESKKKVTWLVAGIVIVFAICWCPIQIMLIMMRLQMHEITITYVAIQVFAHILGYMNSCVNPIVYAFASENFNNSFRRSKLGRLFRAATPWMKHVDPHDAYTRSGGTLGGVSNSNNRPMHNSQSQVHTGSMKNNSNYNNHNWSNNNNTNFNYQNRNNSLNIGISDSGGDNKSQIRSASQTNSSYIECSTPSKRANADANIIQTSPSSGETQTSTVTESYPLNPIETSANNYNNNTDVSLSSNDISKVVPNGSSLSQPITKLEPRDRCEFKLQLQNQPQQHHQNISSKSSDQIWSLKSNSNVIEQQQKQQQEPNNSEPDLNHKQHQHHHQQNQNQHQHQQQQKLSTLNSDQASSLVNGGHAVIMPKQQLVAQVSQSDSRSISHRCEPIKQQI